MAVVARLPYPLKLIESAFSALDLTFDGRSMYGASQSMRPGQREGRGRGRQLSSSGKGGALASSSSGEALPPASKQPNSQTRRGVQRLEQVSKGMSAGTCFHCHQPEYMTKSCPEKGKRKAEVSEEESGAL
jgi:hypothetical protein